MNTKIILKARDVDGSSSYGYPIQVSISKNAEEYNPIGQVKDSTTGYTSQMVTVLTDKSGSAPVEIAPFESSSFVQTKDWDTIVAAEEVGDIGYEMPLNIQVGLTEATQTGNSQYKLIELADIPAAELLDVVGTESGFSVFQLPNNKRPFPRSLYCEDIDSGEIFLFHNLHPEYEPGINFTSVDLLRDRFLYNIAENRIYIPDMRVSSIVARYNVRPFYVEADKPTVLKVYNPSGQINVAPIRTIFDRLNSTLMNNGLVFGENPLDITPSTDTSYDDVYRDKFGNAISGNVKIYPDIVVYLWIEYPNPDGTNPLKNIHEMILPNAVSDINYNDTFMRG